ncbi:merR regulatory family protein [Lyngbya aestuarii BL J]|uniref:MerR regulatory family protein n=1 Tax=Lyngbya aestuarii BL J TaxID=1348334 RepID=U7QKV7_9CYAN|nr:heavy metal-responsive transcriptional regulator [Lyngbya aestuarii]ERT07887.1 merR regulatory family protein [Lyngbya aestuarii BL J]
MVSVTHDKSLKIGEVASLSGLSVKTIRYYEDIGLLSPTVERSESGYRLFNSLVLTRLSFVKRAKSLGLSLSEIREILEIRDLGQLPCGEVKQCLLSKVEAINQQIAALETLRGELKELLAHWQEQPSPNQAAQTICPNIQL